MKLVSFQSDSGPGYGRLEGDMVVPVTVPGRATLREALATGTVADLATSRESPPFPLEQAQLTPVIPDPGKILCVGLNYRAHRDEVGAEEYRYPTVFTRFADSQTGAGQLVRCPGRVEHFDYEGELAVVIGAAGYEIPIERAFDHVLGYGCYNDFTARDWQNHSTQWTSGKNFPGTGAFGPYLATADEVTDVTELALETRVNGEVRQSGVIADLIFDIPALIAYLSSFTVLSPGDVIVTGTPAGAGLFRQPPAMLRDGDVVDVEITGLGVLSNTVEIALPSSSDRLGAKESVRG